LNATKFKKWFKILNPRLLNEAQKVLIITDFEPLLGRPRCNLVEELEMEDRIEFERILSEAFGIQEYYAVIKTELLKLYRIRMAVFDD